MDPYDLTGKALGGFRLTQRLGSGGMATVYRGENVLQPSIVRAIKVIHPTLAVEPEFISRFASEAALLESLTHPHVVRFFGLRQEGGRYFIELELLTGRTLAEVLSSAKGPLAVPDVVRWMSQAAAGVAAAHGLGMIHRDLKPENLFLGEDGLIRVLDFGVACARDEAERVTRRSVAGNLVGTAGYVAPEGWASGEVNAPADVYALGLTLCELLLGHHPFVEDGAARPSRVQLMHAHVTRGVPDPRASRPELPAWLSRLVLRATALDPAQRYPDAGALADALIAGEGGAEEGEGFAAAPRVHEPWKTELALPRFEAPAPPAPPPVAPPSRLPWALGASALLAGGAGYALWPAPPPPDPVVEVTAAPAAPPPRAQGWVVITPPASPVPLGVGELPGRGFREEAAVRSPAAPYAIQRHEVTWGELGPWLAQHPDAGLSAPTPPPTPDTAASGVPWTVADAYCRSLGPDAALPTEEQWEFAARGAELRPFAWGEHPPDAERARVFAGPNAAVGEVMVAAQDHTPGPPEAQVWDLMGNAREWAADPFRMDATGFTPPRADDGAQRMGVVRGLPLRGDLTGGIRVGATWREPLCARGACMDAPTVDGRAVRDALAEVGFRCALDAPPPPPAAQ